MLGNLYGLVLNSYVNNITEWQVVEVDPFIGIFTPIAKPFAFLSQYPDVIAAFHQQDMTLYFATWDSSIFGIEVGTEEASNATFGLSSGNLLFRLVYDASHNQLLALVDSYSRLLFGLPTGKSSTPTLLIDFDSFNIGAVDGIAVTNKGIVYFAFHSVTLRDFAIGSFNIDSPSEVHFERSPCGSAFFLQYLFSNNDKLLGVGWDNADSSYYYFEIVSGNCLKKPLGTYGENLRVYATTYDSSSTLYLSAHILPNLQATLITYNTNTDVLVSFYTASPLLALAFKE